MPESNTSVEKKAWMDKKMKAKMKNVVGACESK